MTDKPVLKLYNTLTRSKDPFEPIDPANVRMYVCGPTVYDFAHIGNARPAIVFDVLFRLLRHVYGADHVTYVRNITDVDDKINARALRDHPELPLNEAIRAVTEKTLSQYLEDVTALGCLEPTHQPRATEHIAGMVEMIRALIAKGHAYVAKGVDGREVLFDVTSMPEYGRLSRRNLDEQQAGARIAVEAHKKNPADFVLWKESSQSEPGWDGEFEGTKIYGRPGWHIECSVMSEHFLGQTFDIHGGGLDLIFPHHENEIAQSTCAHHSERMANVWMHNGFLQVEGRKMSKSEGNFFTIHELMHTEKFGGRKWPGEVLRLAMLMTHYREPIDFSEQKLLEAEALLGEWATIIVDALGDGIGEINSSPVPSQKLVEALSNDLGFSEALAALHSQADVAKRDTAAAFQLLFDCEFLGTLRRGYVGLHTGEFGGDPIRPEKMIAAFSPYQRYRIDRLNGKQGAMQTLIKELSAHGIAVSELSHGEIRITDSDEGESEIEKQISERLAFIREKNWAEADRIRDELLSQGIQLMDSKDSETGERITTWEVKR